MEAVGTKMEAQLLATGDPGKRVAGLRPSARGSALEILAHHLLSRREVYLHRTSKPSIEGQV